MVSSTFFFAAAAGLSVARAASPDEWRSRSIYQVLTDRFARGDGSTDAPCDTGAKKYCGGNYRGLMSQLDYIQGMGFDSVCPLLSLYLRLPLTPFCCSDLDLTHHQEFR